MKIQVDRMKLPSVVRDGLSFMKIIQHKVVALERELQRLQYQQHLHLRMERSPIVIP
jgi:hypothetical protein